MKTWLVEISGHHNSEVPTKRDLVEGESFADALAEAISIAVSDMLDPAGDNRGAIRAAARAIASPELEHVLLQLKEDGDDEPVPYLVWHKAPERPGGDPNIGIGPGFLKCGKYELVAARENRWFKLTEWDGNPARRADLAALGRDELIDRIVRLEAVS